MSEPKAETKPEVPFMDSSEIFMALVNPFISPFLGREPAKPPVKKESTSSAAPKPQELLPPPRGESVETLDSAHDRFRHWGNNPRVDKALSITSYKKARLLRLRLANYYADPEITFITEREADEFIKLLTDAKNRAFGRS